MLKVLLFAVVFACVIGVVTLAALVALAFTAARMLRPVLTGYAKNELHRHYFGRDLPEHEAEDKPKPKASKPAKRKKCTYCGQSQLAAARECTACGANMGNAPVTAPN
jgi:hypothetical protein